MRDWVNLWDLGAGIGWLEGCHSALVLRMWERECPLGLFLPVIRSPVTVPLVK